MDQADDVVDGCVVDRDAGVAALGEENRQLLHGDGVRGGDNVHPGGEDLLHLHVVKLNGSADQFALVVLQAALALRFLHHGDELFFGDALVLGGVEDLHRQLVEQAEEEVQGRQHRQNHPHGRHCPHTELFRLVLCHGFGRDFAKNQHHNGQDDGGDGRAVGGVELGEKYGAQRGGGQVYNVVGDQDAGEQLVVLVQQYQGFLCPEVSILRLAFQTDLVGRREGRLRGGTPGGEHNQNDQNQDNCYTGTVHKGRIISAF